MKIAELLAEIKEACIANNLVDKKTHLRIKSISVDIKANDDCSVIESEDAIHIEAEIVPMVDCYYP